MVFENEDHSYDGFAESKPVPGDPLTVIKELALKVAAAGAVPEQAVAAAEFIVSVCEFADDLERKGESEPAITLLKSAASTGKEVVLTMAGGYQKA